MVSIISILTFLHVDTIFDLLHLPISKVRFVIIFPFDFLFFELVLSYNNNQCVM